MAISEYTYESFLKNISLRVRNLSNYADYTKFESDWLNYFNNIYVPNCKDEFPPRIIIAESAPQGAYLGNANYIFDSSFLSNDICSIRDVYLYRYYRGVFPNIPIDNVKKLTKKLALIELAKQNILILDLLPTHGIKIKSAERTKVKTGLLGIIDYSKLNQYKSKKVNYVFSVPPSLFMSGMCKLYLGSDYTEFGNVNTGQGHAPSIRAIERVIEMGF